MSAQPEKHYPMRQPEHIVQRYAKAVDDEISLIELWIVLIHRKWLVAAITALATAAGLVYGFLVTPRYVYTTTIEIGTQIVNNQVAPIEGQESVRAKVAESYIPLVVQQFQSEKGDKTARYKIAVNAPQNSQILVLNSKGRAEDEGVYKKLHMLVVERLQEDHKRVSNVLRKGFEGQIAEHARKIAALKEEKRLLDAQLNRVADERELLTGEIQQAGTLVAESEQQRAEAVDEVTDATRAMTLLMLSEQLRKTRARLAELRERLATELPNKRDEIEKMLSDNQLAQEDQQTKIEKLRLSLISMLETRAVAPPLRLSEPVGPGKAVIVVLSLMAGLMLAVFAAFSAEFLLKLKTALRRNSASPLPD